MQMNNRDGLLRKARKSKDANDWLAYKKIKNRVNNSIKNAKHKHNIEFLKENISKPEKFWKHIKTLFPTKPKKDNSSSNFVVDDHKTSNETEIANGFSSFFQSAVSNLKTSSIKFKDFVWSLPKSLPIKTVHRFKFRYVSVPEVERLLKELNRKKATGIDEIPARLLKDCSYELAIPISHLINVILETSKIPNEFKIGRVAAVYKNGKKSDFNNYRPITMLPVISKIMEKCVYNQLIGYLESNNLLSTRQFGFRKRRSTESAATLFLDEVHKAMDKGQLTGTIFIDLSKAFDTVSHGILLNKLSSYGIREGEKEFFSDYLFNR
jgi:hypothetical protein